jgi:hypothetical protein
LGSIALVTVILGVELARWKLRPEQKRLRRLRKIGGRR